MNERNVLAILMVVLLACGLPLGALLCALALFVTLPQGGRVSGVSPAQSLIHGQTVSAGKP
jgi:hypothetical protein